MESYIQISKINDFIFCPRSVYLHMIYDNFCKKIYHSHFQVAGSIAHNAIDKKTYSLHKRYLIAIEVSSDELGIAGKIDIYDKETNTLIERKNKVLKIYDGYKYQLYAQLACLEEMGYRVKHLKIHSLSDNKRYNVDLPSGKEWKKFLKIIDDIKNFDMSKTKILFDSKKCERCVYQPLCHKL